VPVVSPPALLVATLPITEANVTNLTADLAAAARQPFDNWAVISLFEQATPTLTVASPEKDFAAADLAIHAQSGADFSVGAGVNDGAILSAAGGWFEMATLFGCPSGVTFDGGSTQERMLWIGANVGDLSSVTNPFAFIGLDFAVRISTDSDLRDATYLSVRATPGKCSAGGKALSSMAIKFYNGFGTDQITDPYYGINYLFVWKVASL
jgi:hypothetical protein